MKDKMLQYSDPYKITALRFQRVALYIVCSTEFSMRIKKVAALVKYAKI